VRVFEVSFGSGWRALTLVFPLVYESYNYPRPYLSLETIRLFLYLSLDLIKQMNSQWEEIELNLIDSRPELYLADLKPLPRKKVRYSYSMYRNYIMQAMAPYDQSCGDQSWSETNVYSCITAYESTFLARVDIPSKSKPISLLSLAQQYAAPLL